MRTRYATKRDALADGWRSISSSDTDISGLGYGGASMFGYKFRSPDGQTSTTIMLTEDKNKLGRPGAWAEMMRVEPVESTGETSE